MYSTDVLLMWSVFFRRRRIFSTLVFFFSKTRFISRDVYWYFFLFFFLFRHHINVITFCRLRPFALALCGINNLRMVIFLTTLFYDNDHLSNVQSAAAANTRNRKWYTVKKKKEKKTYTLIHTRRTVSGLV